jgi:anti-anti-sigma factor
MMCELDERDGCIRLRGEMTIYGAAALKTALFEALAAPRDTWSVDLAEVSEIDTAGVQLLLAAQHVCAGRGVACDLANPSATVREALDLLNISHGSARPGEGMPT